MTKAIRKEIAMHLLLLSSAGLEGVYDASEGQADGQGVGAGKVGCPGLY